MKTKRVKEKLFILFLTGFCLLFSAPVFAQRIVDNAGLLSTEKKENLRNIADRIADTYDFDLVIVTEKSIGTAAPMAYADDFFDNNGYGLGENRDGCLFLQVTGERDYWFSTSGKGVKILNPTAGSKLNADVLKFLKADADADNYYDAYMAFLLDWEKFLVLEANGRSYNFFHQWNIVLIIAAWLISLAIGFLVVQIWKKGMNTALAQTHAAGYVIPGSLNFSEKKDRFLYSTVKKTKRQTENVSSVAKHISSSGRQHGGRGGKY